MSLKKIAFSIFALIALAFASPALADYGGGSQTYWNWFPYGTPDTESVTTSSAPHQFLPAGGAPTARICNQGAVDAYVNAQGLSNSVAAVIGSAGTSWVKAGTCQVFNLKPYGTQFTYWAAITASGSTTLYVEIGLGTPTANNSSGAGGSPTGSAGGDLGGTYPNPTVTAVGNVTTGVLPAANGGAGSITGALKANGSGLVSQAASTDLSDTAALARSSNNLSFFSSTTSAQLATLLSDETGTGLAVFGTNPVLTTPNLGTPSALVLTNATGLPNAGLLNSAVVIGTTSVSLGATVAAFAGVTSITSSNASSWQLGSGAASCTNPTFIPNRGSTATGVGSQASGNVCIGISGTGEVARFTSTGINNANIGASTAGTINGTTYAANGTAGVDCAANSVTLLTEVVSKGIVTHC